MPNNTKGVAAATPFALHINLTGLKDLSGLLIYSMPSRKHCGSTSSRLGGMSLRSTSV